MVSRFLTTAWLLVLLAARSEAAEKPNFVFFLSDDHSKADYGCYGFPVDLTPTVDRLAREGLVFDRMFTAQAVCAPSRAVLFTGMDPIRNGLFVQHGSCRPGTRTVYDALTRLGYDVSLIGKMHVKPDTVFHWGTPPPILAKKLSMDQLDSFLAEHVDKPFCLFLGSRYPHGPYPKKTKFPKSEVVPHPYMKDAAERNLAGYYDHIAEEDRELARVLDLLDQHGLSQNTVFLYSSDHGGGKDAKFTVYDRGLGVPFIVRWPGKIEPGRTSALASYADVLPTMVEIAGGSPLAGIDGKSFAAVLQNPALPHRDHVFGLMTQQGVHNTHVFPRRSSRGPRFHYIRNFNTLEKIARDEQAGKQVNPFYRLGAEMHPDTPEEQLFDTQADPWELHNLAADPGYAETKERLKRAMFEWMEQQNDFLATREEIPFLESKHPVDQSGAAYTCPPHLIGTVEHFANPHEVTAPR